MKKTNLFFWSISLGILLIASGCVKDYVPDSGKFGPEGDYFDFANRVSMILNVDYNAPGHKAYVEVYDEAPVEEVDGVYVKKNILPVYSAFTDDNGKLQVEMYIPAAIKDAYLYTSRWGLPICVKLTSVNGGFEYNAASVKSELSLKPATRAAMSNFKGAIPYEFGAWREELYLKSICKWDMNGRVSKVETGDDYLSVTTALNEESIPTISKRVQNFFDATPNKKETFLTNEGETNISVTENDTELDLVFMAERAAYQNSIGYYYYKKGNEPQSRDEMWKMAKFILFPNVTSDNQKIIPEGATVRLQFFGENYDQPATDKFPAGYAIGWFYISNGFGYGGLESNAYLCTPSNVAFSGQKTIFYSNDKSDYRRFVLLNDTKSGLAVLGFEDQVVVNEQNEDYSDVLFFVKASKNVENPGVEVPEENPTPEVKTMTLSGTLAFEDVWPYGGDYDLNDVAVAYERVISFTENNNIQDITESFTYKHPDYSAAFNNFFAIQVNNEGTKQEFATQDVSYEAETKSFIINKSAKQSVHPTYVIKRTFGAGINKDVVAKDFNPYIIVGNTTDTSYPVDQRVEVHLPKHNATLRAKDMAGKGDDVYYIKKDGNYPFAIDITDYEFVLAKEKQNIGVAYPKFNSWVQSYGRENADWYKNPAK